MTSLSIGMVVSALKVVSATSWRSSLLRRMMGIPWSYALSRAT